MGGCSEEADILVARSRGVYIWPEAGGKHMQYLIEFFITTTRPRYAFSSGI